MRWSCGVGRSSLWSIVVTAWFPGAVVTHNKACSLVLDLFKSVNACLIVGVMCSS